MTVSAIFRLSTYSRLLPVLFIWTVLTFSCKSRIVVEEVPVTLVPDTSSSQQVEGNLNNWPAEDQLFLTLRRTPCFGHCPVYRIDIYQDGSVRYEGVQFTERLGTYRGQLSATERGKLSAMAEEIGFSDLKSEYPSAGQRIMDLPTIQLTMLTPEGRKTIVSRNYANPDIPGEQEEVDRLRMLHEVIDQVVQSLPLRLVGEGLQH